MCGCLSRGLICVLLGDSCVCVCATEIIHIHRSSCWDTLFTSFYSFLVCFFLLYLHIWLADANLYETHTQNKQNYEFKHDCVLSIFYLTHTFAHHSSISRLVLTKILCVMDVRCELKRIERKILISYLIQEKKTP